MTCSSSQVPTSDRPNSQYVASDATKFFVSIFAVIFVALGLASLLGVLRAVLAGRVRESGGLVFIALILSVLGVWFVLRVRRVFSVRVMVSPQGLEYAERGKSSSFTWDDVVAVRENIYTLYYFFISAGTYHHYSLRLRDGHRFTFDDTFGHAEGLGDTVQQQVTGHLLPIALAQYKAGEEISFGKLTLSATGVRYGTRTLGWVEIDNIDMVDGFVFIYKLGCRRVWAVVPVARIPNVYVFLSMLQQIRTPSETPGMALS
jgi:hypothetical protein